MKIINKIILAVAGLSLMTACNLDEYPYGFYSENNFYKTPADAEAAVNYIYDAINYIEFSRAIVFIGDMNTDCLNPKGDATPANKALDGWNRNTFNTNTTLGNVFKYSYIVINRANAVIANVGKMDNIDEHIMNRYLGEAYFMRGYAYFMLARNFGKVPVHLEPVTELGQSAVPAAKSLDEIYGIVINDFAKAVELLPFYTTPQMGRVDKAAAAGFLAKAYLYVASAKDHGTPEYRDMSIDVDDYYAKAGEAAAIVVDNPAQTTYRLDPDLLGIFDVEKPNGPEHLFLMSMDRTGTSEGQYSKISKMYIPYIAGGEIFFKSGDSETLVGTHDGYSEYQTARSFYDSYAAGDLRRDWLICSTIYDKDGNVLRSLEGDSDGKNILPYPFSLKFIDPQYQGDKTSTRPFLLRYSDVALIYAEAMGPTAKAYELVNAIRNRAGLAPLAEGLDKAAFREAVLNERSFELAFEGNECYDLRRWNRLHTHVTAVKEQGLQAEDVVFYPIPSMETELNPNLKPAPQPEAPETPETPEA